ncbi:MAG: thiamine pyrophosphate-binding protein, partial [Bacillota bacterium]
MGMVSGGHLVARQLHREGAKVVFTLCGGHVMGIYDGCLDLGIRVVDTRHEQAAAFAADAWGRLTGRPGVAIVTAGPGVTNAVTAVATALRAQSPMVVIGGQGPLAAAGRGSLQEMDTLSLMRPVTKWAVQVQETARLPEWIHLAFRRALAGVPGPVYVEIPLDVLMNLVEESQAPLWDPAPDRPAAPAPSAQVEAAAALLREARRPAVLVGSQIRWSPDWQALAEFAQAALVPVYASGLARGIPGAGFLHSRKLALREADLVLVAGTPLDFRLQYGHSIAPDARLIQVDLDPAEPGRNRTPAVGVAADPGTFFRQLLEAGCAPRDPAAREAWLDRLREEEAARLRRMEPGLTSGASPVDPLRLAREIDQWLPDRATVIGDGGDFVATAAYVIR